jgi:hypothetical protein
MERRKHNEARSGALGWALVAAGVAVWDIHAKESLSHAFQRGMDNPLSRPLVLGALAITAAHLVQVLPRQLDPFYATIDRVRQYQECTSHQDLALAVDP